MTRHALLALAAIGLAAAPASAQDDPTAPADSVAADTSETIAPDPERARAVYGEGLELYRADDFDGALLKYEEALVYSETYAPAALGRAQVLARLGRLEDSRTAFEQAVAMAEASDASNADQILASAQRGLEQVSAVLEQRAAAEAAAAEQAGAQAVVQKVEQATQMLAGNEIDFATASDAYALLEQARLDGYDTDNVAFYYAKALNAMERGADAIPFAETAVAQSEGQDDRSIFYIQLGLAHMGAGNAAEARAAFEAIEEGQAWHGWAQHYIGQLDAEG